METRAWWGALGIFFFLEEGRGGCGRTFGGRREGEHVGACVGVHDEAVELVAVDGQRVVEGEDVGDELEGRGG